MQSHELGLFFKNSCERTLDDIEAMQPPPLSAQGMDDKMNRVSLAPCLMNDDVMHHLRTSFDETVVFFKLKPMLLAASQMEVLKVVDGSTVQV